MAKVLYNDFAIITGSINGNTYSHNRYGNYIRNRANPSNPQTTLQDWVRNQCSSLNSYWASLSMAEIKLWNQSASNYRFPNHVGGYYTPTGYQLFLMVNQNRLITQNSVSNTPFPLGGVGNLVSLYSRVNVTAGTFKVLFSCDSFPGLLVKLSFTNDSTGNRSLGSCKNMLKLLRDQSTTEAITTNCGAVELDITSEYDSQFGTDIAGNQPPTSNIFFKFVPIRQDWTSGNPVFGMTEITP